MLSSLAVIAPMLLSAPNVAYVTAENVAWRSKPKTNDPSEATYPLAFLRINTKLDVVSKDQRPWIEVRLRDAAALATMDTAQPAETQTGFIHASLIADQPAKLDTLLDAAMAAEAAGKRKLALKLTVRAVALPASGHSALPNLRDRLHAVGETEAAIRVQESIDDAVHYIAFANGYQTLLIAEQRADGQIYAIARAADRPSWYRALVRAELEGQRFYGVRSENSVPVQTLRWHTTQSDYEDVSLAELISARTFAPGVYATTALTGLTLKPGQFEKAVTQLPKIRTMDAFSRIQDAKLIGLEVQSPMGGKLVQDVRFTVSGYLSEYEPGPINVTAWAIEGLNGIVPAGNRVRWLDDQAGWYGLSNGLRFSVAIQESDAMWVPSEIVIVTADEDDVVEVQTVPLETGGC